MLSKVIHLQSYKVVTFQLGAIRSCHSLVLPSLGGYMKVYEEGCMAVVQPRGTEDQPASCETSSSGVRTTAVY